MKYDLTGPCSEAAMYIAEFFYDIAKNKDNDLDFKLSDVCATPCGASACHAGWGAFLPNYSGAKGSKYYVYGADAIAQVMGFDRREDYQTWADNNPEMWGNPHGMQMFEATGWVAFADYTEAEVSKFIDLPVQPKNITLTTITQWYEDMSTRLPSNPSWEPPTTT